MATHSAATEKVSADEEPPTSPADIASALQPTPTMTPEEDEPQAGDCHTDVCHDDFDGDAVRAFASATRAAEGDESDAGIKAAKRAQHHVRQGHLQKAARVLHSVDSMADLRLPEVQQAVIALHPVLPSTSIIPALPPDAPQLILEDDEVMVSLLRRSDNGSASGPSGWGGNMLSSLAQSDLCRMGIIALLKDIMNGNLPQRASSAAAVQQAGGADEARRQVPPHRGRRALLPPCGRHHGQEGHTGRCCTARLRISSASA